MSNYQINQVHLMITGGVFCLLLCVLLSLNKNYYDRSKSAILQIQFSAAVLLFTDSVGMLVDGKPGIVFRRIVFCASLLSFLFAIISGMAFLSFVTFKLFQNRRVSELPKRVWGSGILLILAILLVFVMSFTGKYFYIDEHNHYQRGEWFAVSYIIPLICMFIMLSLIIQYRKNVSKLLLTTLFIFAIASPLGGILQYFFYGQYIINIVVGVSACFLYAVSVLEQNNEIIRHAYIDNKTGLINGTGFVNRIEEIRHTSDITMYDAFYLDLVRFGGFNQKYGSKVADDIMKAYVKSLCDFTSDEELIGRLGGNYFIALISKTKRDAFLRKIIECEVEVEIGKKNEKVKVSANCGGYSIDDNNITGLKILDYTGIALNLAKHTYKIPFLFLTPEIQNEIYENKKREKQILKSIENKDFCVYYQPKINCRENSICGAEALARWNLDGNILEPAVFIPVLEQNGAICRLDFLILEKVCGDIKRWEEKGFKIPRVSVNFSRKNLGNINLAADIYEVIKKYDVKADNIEIEITEKLDEYSIETLKDFVDNLHSYGIKAAIDNFGIGSSSMDMLRKVDFDVLKIDRTFVDNSTEKQQKILKHIVGIAKDTGAQVIAEGVELMMQCDLLMQLGCDEIQGVVFDKPLEGKEFEKRLEERIYS